MPSLIPLDDTIGAGLIGLVISTMIYGINWLQAYLYYTEYSSRDSRFLKAYVGILMVLDTFHVALLVVCLYHYTVTNFGDYVVLQANTWSYVWQAFVGGVLSVLVESFFALRVYRVSGNRLIFASIGALCVAKLACTIGFTVISNDIAGFSDAHRNLKWSISSLSTAIACDAVIAATLIYYLRKNKTAFARTNRAINLLITYALNTCLLTSVANAVCMIMWIKKNTTMLYALFYFILVRLYSVSLLSTLNSRQTVRNELEKRTDFITMSNLAAAAGPGFSEETSGQTVFAMGDQKEGDRRLDAENKDKLKPLHPTATV